MVISRFLAKEFITAMSLQINGLFKKPYYQKLCKFEWIFLTPYPPLFVYDIFAKLLRVCLVGYQSDFVCQSFH